MSNIQIAEKIQSLAVIWILVLGAYVIYLQFSVREWLKENHPELAKNFNAMANLKATKMFLFPNLDKIPDLNARNKLGKIRASLRTLILLILTVIICMIYTGVNTHA